MKGTIRVKNFILIISIRLLAALVARRVHVYSRLP